MCMWGRTTRTRRNGSDRGYVQGVSEGAEGEENG